MSGLHRWIVTTQETREHEVYATTAEEAELKVEADGDRTGYLVESSTVSVEDRGEAS